MVVCRSFRLNLIGLLAWGAILLCAPPRAGAQLVLNTPFAQYGGGALISAAVSPDMSLIVSGSGRGGYLWSVTAGNVICLLDYPKAFTAVAFSPDSKTIATGTADGAVILWNAQTHQKVKTLAGYPGGIGSLKFSPDGAKILAHALDRATLRDVNTGNTIQTFQHTTDAISSTDLSSDGTRVLTAGVDGSAYVWNAGTGSQLFELALHTEMIETARISPDGTRALLVSNDNSASLWNLQTGDILASYAYDVNVYGAAFSQDGNTMLTLQSDGIVNFYDVDSMDLLTQSRSSDWQSNNAWQIDNAECLRDGQRVLSRTLSGDILLWDITTLKPLQSFQKHTPPVFSGTFSPDGARVLLGMRDFRGLLYDTWTAALLDTYTITSGAIGSISSVAYTRDGARIVAGTSRNAVIWDAKTKLTVKVLGVSAEWVNAAVFSPDATRVATGDSDGLAILWNATTGATISTLTGHTDEITCVAYSPDGTRILTGSLDKTAILWNAATGVQIRTIADHDESVLAVAFSPDGTRLLTAGADNLARLWDVQSGNLIRTFSGHRQAVTAAAFSPDGKQLLTGGEDTLAILWDVATGNKLRILDRHTDAINCVALSPDGKRALTGSVDGTALLWPGVLQNAAQGWSAYH